MDDNKKELLKLYLPFISSIVLGSCIIIASVIIYNSNRYQYYVYETQEALRMLQFDAHENKVTRIKADRWFINARKKVIDINDTLIEE